MLDEAAISGAHAARPLPEGGGKGEGSTGPAPSPDAVVRAVLRHHPVEAAGALGLSVIELSDIVRRPDLQRTLDTIRELEADHAARQRQAAQALAMRALSEILTKRNDADANPVEVRRAASALSRLSLVGRVSRPVERWDRSSECFKRRPHCESEETALESRPTNATPNSITDETLSTLATGTVTRVLDKLHKLDNPETARSTLGRDVCQDRGPHWLTDLKRSPFFAYRKLPRTLDHPDLGWGLATVRVRYRGHEREPTLIRLINRGGPDPWVVHSFRIDSS